MTAIGWTLARVGVACAMLGMTACAASVTVPSPSLDPETIEAALRDGRDRAVPCLALMDHDALEFHDCVLYKAGQVPGEDMRALAARLGAYWYGWVTADIHGAYGLEGADAAARDLLDRATPLQSALGKEDAALCSLVETPCERVLGRKREILANRSGA